MEITANLIEMHQIINSEHANPHNILGMHMVKDGKSIAVRAFIPSAKEIFVVDTTNSARTFKMEKVSPEGFFELVIENSKPFNYIYNAKDYYGNKWSEQDPYNFKPSISDLDLYLFAQGTHYEIFDKLGAHLKEIDGVSGVSFGVWAPNAKRVSVIGDFNAWDGRINQMRSLEMSGVWEIFIPCINEYEKYKFEIKTKENFILQKSDPYANFAELRPNTASVVFDINGYSWNDLEWELSKKEFNLNKPINIYEVQLGSWKHVVEENDRSLTYIEYADKLVSYVKEMGFTHIELLPILEYPYDGSWGYQVTGYFAPTSRFGTPKEFMYFIDKCHQNDIAVILDWVPAHFPKDVHGLANFDGTALYEHADPKKGEHPDWGTLIFNYGRNEVKNFLIANAIFWIEKYHLDGLRVDAVASMLYLDYGKQRGNWIPNEFGGRENFEAVEFLKHMNSVILGRYPGVLMIAEESTSWAGVTKPPDCGGLGFNLKWNMGWMNDFLRYVSKDPIHRKFHHNDLTFSMIYAYSENFILVLSHDEVVHGKSSLIEKMPGDLWQKFANLRVAIGFMYGHPGKKLIFMGGEFAQFSEWSESKSLDWHLLDFDKNREMQLFFKDLNHIYLKESAYWIKDFDNEGFEWINCNDSESSVISFLRRGQTNEEILIFVCNFTPTPHFNHRIGVQIKGKYLEILNSDDLKYGGSGILNTNGIYSKEIFWDNRENCIEVNLPPLGISVFKLVDL